jgi:hypothetical protein
MRLDLAVDELARRGGGEQRVEHFLGHAEIAVAVTALVPEVERLCVRIVCAAADRARIEFVVVSVEVVRSAQKRGR